MTRSLVIVESPAKAATINRYLGDDYLVKSSVGHVRDLKKQGMGLEPENGWKAHYEVDLAKKKVISELVRAAKGSDRVYLATDLDREGEAIAWHLRELIGGDLGRYKRVIFSEITAKAIREAFEHPTELNMDRVNAQQARRFLDRVVGFELSPLLWQRIARGLSAGRVQSVAVRMIVEREREIRTFEPESYWEIQAPLARGRDGPFDFKVFQADGKKSERFDEATARDLVRRLVSAARIDALERNQRKSRSRPSPPLITSTMQREATRLGFGIARTMRLAQQLYEAGLITYMRTDSTNLSADAIAACRDYIGREFGKDYLPDKPRRYASRQSAQEAHEAIRPTDVALRPERLSLGKDTAQARRLYDLIWRRFVACQMEDAITLSVSLVAEVDHIKLKRTGTRVVFEGFGRVAPKSGKEEVPMPDWEPFQFAKPAGTAQAADIKVLPELEPDEKFTKPKPRFSESGLVRELEKHGIGRPSTYASIIQTIQARGYVRLEKKAFFSEPIGEVVTDRLLECFPKLMDYGFTSDLEQELDQIALGERDWLGVLDVFHEEFCALLGQARERENGMRRAPAVTTPVTCPTCERPMKLRIGRSGMFLGCSGFELPEAERCRQTLSLEPTIGLDAHQQPAPDADQGSGTDSDQDAKEKRPPQRQKCDICDAPMDAMQVDERRRLHLCSRRPVCQGMRLESGEFAVGSAAQSGFQCDRCGSQFIAKKGRFGQYFRCTNSNCGNTRKMLRNGEPAPPRMPPINMPNLTCEKADDHFVLREGAKGLFLAASKYPKHRETRSPRVSEVADVKSQLPEKFLYIAEAPREDPDGNPTDIRFSTKRGDTYLSSQVDGKASKWRAFYQSQTGTWDWVETKTRGTTKKSPPRRNRRAAQ